MTQVIVPRPIALVSSVSAAGVCNLAPFSFFAGLTVRPALLAVSVARRRGETHKDTAANVLETGELVVNVVTGALLERAVAASAEYPPEVDEFTETGLTPVPSVRVRPPRVQESPVALECALHRHVDLEGSADLLIARILLAHVDDAVLDDQGRVDPRRLDPVGRLGDSSYAALGPLRVVDPPRPAGPRS